MEAHRRRAATGDHCPGPFRGYLPLPLPLSCGTVHVLMGLYAGALPRAGARGALLGAYVLYQFVEEIPGGDVAAFVRDVCQFLVGYALGRAWCRKPAAADRAADRG